LTPDGDLLVTGREPGFYRLRYSARPDFAAVNVDGAALTPEQKEILRTFTRGGGTLLTGPPGWKDPSAAAGSITLEKAELERLTAD